MANRFFSRPRLLSPRISETIYHICLEGLSRELLRLGSSFQSLR